MGVRQCRKQNVPARVASLVFILLKFVIKPTILIFLPNSFLAEVFINKEIEVIGHLREGKFINKIIDFLLAHPLPTNK